LWFTQKTKVTLADGSIKVTSTVCHNITIQFNDHSEVMNMMVMNLPDYDAIIGMPWFESNSNVPIDWKTKTIKFKSNIQTQTNKVNQPSLVPSSSPILVQQVSSAPSVSSLETVKQPVSVSSANVKVNGKSRVNKKSNRITVPQIKLALKRKQIEELYLIDIHSLLDQNIYIY
jgi:hypothetical protein